MSRRRRVPLSLSRDDLDFIAEAINGARKPAPPAEPEMTGPRASTSSDDGAELPQGFAEEFCRELPRLLRDVEGVAAKYEAEDADRGREAQQRLAKPWKKALHTSSGSVAKWLTEVLHLAPLVPGVVAAAGEVVAAVEHLRAEIEAQHLALDSAPPRRGRRRDPWRTALLDELAVYWISRNYWPAGGGGKVFAAVASALLEMRIKGDVRLSAADISDAIARAAELLLVKARREALIAELRGGPPPKRIATLSDLLPRKR